MTESSGSTESSMSHLKARSSPPLFFFAALGLYQRAFHPLSTTLAVQCRKEYVMSLAVGQRSGGRNAVGFGRCKFQRRGESKPTLISLESLSIQKMSMLAYPHGSVESACDLIVLLQSRAAPQNFW